MMYAIQIAFVKRLALSAAVLTSSLNPISVVCGDEEKTSPKIAPFEMLEMEDNGSRSLMPLADSKPDMDWFNHTRRSVSMPIWLPAWVERPFAEFDAEAWAAALADIGCKSVVFAVENLDGEVLYPSKHDRYIGHDVVGPMVEACHAHDIKFMAYYNLAGNREAVEKHPEWQVKYESEWKLADPGNPEYAEYVLEMLEELVSSYSVDGIWFDWYNAPTDFIDRVRQRLASWRTDLVISFNGSGINNDQLTQAVDYLSTEGHSAETCSLHSKLLSRWGKPFELQVPEGSGWLAWRPHTTPALIVQAALTGAHGGVACFGLAFTPHGKLIPGQLAQLQKVFSWIEAREQWFTNVTPFAEVGVLMSSESLSEWYHPPRGLHNALATNHIPFEIVRPDASWDRYKVLIIPEMWSLNEVQAHKFREYVKNGGNAMVFWGAYQNLQDVLGIKVEGPMDPELEVAYISPIGEGLWKNMEKMSLGIGGEDATYLVRPDGAEVLASVTWPFTKPQQPYITANPQNAPADKPSEYASVLHNRYGKGEVIYIAPKLTREIETLQKSKENMFSPSFHKQLIVNLLEILGGTDLLKTNASGQYEFNLASQNDRFLLHITNCSLIDNVRYETTVDNMAPALIDVSINLQSLNGARNVRLVPEEKELQVRINEGRLEFEAQVGIHSIYEIY